MRRAGRFTRVLLAALVFVASIPAGAQAPAQVEWRDVGRIISFGDVHGADAELLQLLREAGVLDAGDHWAAGNAHVVSLGDLLDRGSGSRRVMDLLMRLQSEALGSGGRLHVLVGNHEAMNLMGDLRYVTPQDFAAYVDLESPAQRQAAREEWMKRPCEGNCPSFESLHPPGYFGHRAAFAPGGRYGAWLLSLPVAIRINDTVFMHAGPSAATQGMALTELNIRYRSALIDNLHVDTPQDTLLGDEGPNWNRGPALCNEAIESDVLVPFLRQLGAGRLVIGHTPTKDSRVVTRFGGKVVKLDTGMNRSVYRGRPSALVIDENGLKVRYVGEPELTVPQEEPLYVAPDSIADLKVLDVLRQGEITLGKPGGESTQVGVELGGQRVLAEFTPASAAVIHKELAAFRLDRALNLGIVPATVQRKVSGREGILQARPAHGLTQKEYQEQGKPAGGSCRAAPQYQLMYALDTLVGNAERTASSIIMDLDVGRVLATSFAGSFSRDEGLPHYLRARPPTPGVELGRRLGSLNEAVLEQVLGDLVDARARRAILKRRDAMLAAPQRAAN